MTSKSKKLLEEIHPLHIIRAVEKWPALYAKERANTHFRQRIWCEVAKELFPDWNTFTKLERDNKISDLNKKWRNLRDTFKREVEVERKVREGHDVKKKTYVYYSHMAFLRPHLADSDSDDAPPPPPPPLPPPKPKKLRPLPNAPLDSLAAPAPSASVFVEEIDEDKHFLMSLIPSFRKMTEDEKLTAKMEILKAIKGVRSGNAANFSYQEVDSLAYNTELEVIRDVGDIKREIFSEMEPVSVIFEEKQNSDEE